MAEIHGTNSFFVFFPSSFLPLEFIAIITHVSFFVWFIIHLCTQEYIRNENTEKKRLRLLYGQHVCRMWNHVSADWWTFGMTHSWNATRTSEFVQRNDSQALKTFKLIFYEQARNYSSFMTGGPQTTVRKEFWSHTCFEKLDNKKTVASTDSNLALPPPSPDPPKSVAGTPTAVVSQKSEPATADDARDAASDASQNAQVDTAKPTDFVPIDIEL